MGPLDFFLNRSAVATAVPAPAFSLTKVMALLVPPHDRPGRLPDPEGARDRVHER